MQDSDEDDDYDDISSMFDFDEDEDLSEQSGYSDDEADFDYGDEAYDDEDSSSDLVALSRLYSSLSKEQVELLQDYTKHFAQRVFLEERGSLVLDSINNEGYLSWKKRELSDIRAIS